MSRDGVNFFPRGTYDDTGASDHLLGREMVIEDIDFGQAGGVKPTRSGNMVRLRLVKNSSGMTLLPKRVVRLKTPAGGEVDGYGYRPGDRCYPIDEFLPATGVPDGGNFYIVVEGPATCYTDSVDSAANIFVAGDLVTAATNAATTSVTAGRVGKAAITGATEPLALNLLNYVGRACTAYAASTAKDSDLLVNVGKW